MAKFTLPFFSKKPKAPKKKKGFLREWFDALVWAAGVAILIRTFLIEAYVIPTASMERSLLVGDYLFVSKFHYGARLPMVPLAVPFVHNRLPGTNTKSYLDWIEFGYARLPGITSIKRGDAVVFNYPADDIQPNNPQLGPVGIASVKENYIKRCTGVAGDTLEVRAGVVYVNGEAQPFPAGYQALYLVRTNGEPFNRKALERLGIRPDPAPLNPNGDYVVNPYDRKLYQFRVPPTVAEELKKFGNVVELVADTSLKAGIAADEVFPYDPKQFPWNTDYVGPFVLPKAGMTVALTPQNAKLYQRCIQVYEDNETYNIKEGKAYLGDTPLEQYTFRLNYYYMMGDNRYNSQDSRVWGFVPESHIVGKPLFIFFSREDKVRWNRIFKGID